MADDDTGDEEEAVDCTLAEAAFANCDSPVGQIEACLSEQLNAAQQELAHWQKLDCNNSFEDIDDVPDYEISPGCEATEEDCAALLW